MTLKTKLDVAGSKHSKTKRKKILLWANVIISVE